MIKNIQSTRKEYITCQECYDELEIFAESNLKQKETDKAMILIQEHLESCMDCKEEYELLLASIKAVRDEI